MTSDFFVVFQLRSRSFDGPTVFVTDSEMFLGHFSSQASEASEVDEDMQATCVLKLCGFLLLLFFI